MKRKAITTTVQKISLGTLTTVTDIILYSFYLLGASVGKSSTGRGIAHTFCDADEAFKKFNSKTIIEAVSKLKTKYKYINLTKNNNKTLIEITKLGKQRLSEIVPTYRTKRPWNGKLNLVSFDIPENKRVLRDLLRMKLKKLGAGLLQNSIWLTPYDPTQVLKPIIDRFSMDEWVIITPIEKNAILPYGEKGLPALLEKIYSLSNLNNRYLNYINKPKRENKLVGVFEYLDILKDDPQLPFELEPEGFHAQKAYQQYNIIINS